jgi:hypothetical protein
MSNNMECCTIIGRDSDANGSHDIIVGFGNKVFGDKNIVIGNNNKVNGTGNVVIGHNQTIEGDNHRFIDSDLCTNGELITRCAENLNTAMLQYIKLINPEST